MGNSKDAVVQRLRKRSCLKPALSLPKGYRCEKTVRRDLCGERAEDCPLYRDGGGMLQKYVALCDLSWSDYGVEAAMA